MAINKIQFQKGLNWGEFYQKYGTEKKCERILQELC